MIELSIATHNKDKFRELEFILKKNDIIIKYEKNIITPKEKGDTLEENVIEKLNFYAKHLPPPILAEDTGLFVDAIDGKPGVLSARFGGEDATYLDNYKRLLQVMKEIPYHKRTAKFVSVGGLLLKDGTIKIFQGEINGFITFQPKGLNGFGYDPVFYLPEVDKTLAELILEEKCEVSHRSKMMQKLINFLINGV